MWANLYADRMMTTSPQNAEEVWNATEQHARFYSDAAHLIGLTNSEYREFRDDLLDGKALYVTIPAHVDAMAGSHHGRPYAIKHVRLRNDEPGWVVALNDGTRVYVPKKCGNLSMIRPTRVAHKRIRLKAPYVTRALPPTAPETIVSMTPPAPPAVIAAVPIAAPVAVAHGGGGLWGLLVPIIGIIGGKHTTTPPPPPVVPPCSGGSNTVGVCQGGR